jgi:metal-dependent amidase/aminoacylase/carboxypeptidase family protein
LGTLKEGDTPYSLHNSGYNFNDDMIAYGGHFWIRLLEERLKIQILK